MLQYSNLMTGGVEVYCLGQFECTSQTEGASPPTAVPSQNNKTYCPFVWYQNIWSALFACHKARVWQTDGRTDGQMDRIATHKTALVQLRRAVIMRIGYDKYGILHDKKQWRQSVANTGRRKPFILCNVVFINLWMHFKIGTKEHTHIRKSATADIARVVPDKPEIAKIQTTRGVALHLSRTPEIKLTHAVGLKSCRFVWRTSSVLFSQTNAATPHCSYKQRGLLTAE